MHVKPDSPYLAQRIQYANRAKRADCACAGVNRTEDSPGYVCSNNNLGLIQAPRTTPQGLFYGYQRFGNYDASTRNPTPAGFLAKIVLSNGFLAYPDCRGFLQSNVEMAGTRAYYSALGCSVNVIVNAQLLPPGTFLDRFGDTSGKFFIDLFPFR
ncbi:MAG: hypothetical protein Q9202_006739 [Teloschistes flavicans]